jgi:hypothetical protein
MAEHIREGRGEIQAAQRQTLPKLITIDDIWGDLQMHSTWSDGSHTIAENKPEAPLLPHGTLKPCGHRTMLWLCPQMHRSSGARHDRVGQLTRRQRAAGSGRHVSR